MTRAVAFSLRVSSTAALFLAGVVIVGVRPEDEVASFFAVTSLLPLLIAIVGLELHTVTDRLVAGGLDGRVALWWVLKREAPALFLVTLALYVISLRTSLHAEVAAYAIGLTAAGILAQEAGRILVVSSKVLIASGLMALRSALPFVIVVALWWSGAALTVTDLFGLWMATSVVASVVALIVVVSVPPAAHAVALPPPSQVRVQVLSYLSMAVMIRALLSLDVIIVATVAPSDIALYGLLNAGLLAFYSLADIAVVQWRMGRLLAMDGDARLKARQELSAAAVLAVLGVFAFGVAAAYLTGASLRSAVFMIAGFALASGAALWSQMGHVLLYSKGEDGLLKRSYAAGACVFTIGLVWGAWLDLLWVIVLGKAAGWLVVALMHNWYNSQDRMRAHE